MRYASFFSGIEAATVAWHPLGWEPVFFSEIEPFPNKVLAHHYPSVPNLGDITKIQNPLQYGAINLMVGGSPCQSFSVAGLRKGLADPRGNLALEYLRMADTIQPRWIVWENVPGVLSSNGGRDFGAFLGALAELGYGFAYRVLDAQFFGVPQRRRRVFIVAHSGGNWQRAAAVLFESESMRRNFTPGGKARQEVAAVTPSSIGGYSEGAGTLRANGGDLGGGSETLCITPAITMATGQGNAEILRDQCPTLNCNHEAPIVFDTTQITSPSNGSKCAPGQPCHTLNAHGHTPSIAHRSTVRRLTPMECERLQGFPDNYTNIPAARDTPRYKALGNSMAVPVMRWIGKRIQKVDSL